MAKLYFRYGTVGSAKTMNLLAVAHNYRQQVRAFYLSRQSEVFQDFSSFSFLLFFFSINIAFLTFFPKSV